MKIDLTGTANEETPATLITPGQYQAIVTDAVESASKLKGTPCLELHLELLTGGEFKGRHLTDWLYLTPKAKWRVRQFLEAVGRDIPDGDFELEPATLIGDQVRIQVKHEVYEQKVMTRVDRYEPVEQRLEANAPFSDGVPF